VDILETSVERLRAAGLSAAKAAAVKDLATRTLEGTVPTMAQVRRMSDEEIIERLTTVRGIGRWTVEMLLLFRLGRPDVLPLGDLGVRKGFARTFNRRALLDPLVLHRRAERWRPYRSVASWYLWRALDLERA
jgi:DNA-3-methyladenine glycosylase II